MDLTKLNKRKTYIGLQYGTSFIAKEIRKFSKDYAPNSADIPTHICGLVYRFGEWWVYESHADGVKKLGIPSGVRHYRASEWANVEPKFDTEYKIYHLPLLRKNLELFIGQPYSIGDIRSLLRVALFNGANGTQKDRKGLICSEYIANCCPKITKYYNLPAHCITPAHFQNYIDTMGIEEVGKNDDNTK